MRRRAILSFIAACALSACATQTAPPVASGTEGMRWIEVEGDGPKLVFGLPDSDVLVVMLTCTPRSGQVQIAFSADPKVRERTLNIRSGAASAKLPVSATPTEMDDLWMEGVAPASAPVLASFARSGDFAIGVGAATTLPPAEPAKAKRFLESCRS